MAGDLLPILLTLAAVATAVHVLVDWVRWPPGDGFASAADRRSLFEADTQL